jgi:hypothetical protein
MTDTRPWIVRHRDGWCALPVGATPDPDALNDPTLCGHVVNLRGGSRRGQPDCPDCLATIARTLPARNDR